jgi:flagellar basal body-associated protein FliL
MSIKLKKWHKIVLVLLVLGAIAGVLIWKWANKPNPNLKNATPDATVTTAALLKEFSDNDSLAQKKYLGKVVEVNGIIKKMVASDSAAVLNLGDTTGMSVVQCQLDVRNNADAKTLKEGDMVTVKGKLAGFTRQEADGALAELLDGAELGTDVVLNFCAVIKK